MGRKVPTGIQEFSDLDVGNYLGNVENFEEKYSQQDNLLMYGLQLRISQPAQRANRIHFENFVIGTKEDPNAEQEATWQKTAGRLKSFCKALGVPLEGEDMDTITQHVMRKNVCFRIEHRPGKGEYAGRTFVNVSKWAGEGLMEPMLDAVEASAAPVVAPTPITATPLVQPVAPASTAPATLVPPAPPTAAPGGQQYPFVPKPPGAA